MARTDPDSRGEHVERVEVVNDVEADGARLLELLDSLSADLAVATAPERPDEVAGESPSAYENRAIHTARSVVEQSRAAALAMRVEEARGTARRLVEERRERRGGRPRDEATSGTVESHETDTGLRATLSESARRLSRVRTTSDDPVEMLQAIVNGVLVAVPNVVGASITLMDKKGALTTHAPSNEMVAEIDRIQTELREGPCIDALDDAHADTTIAPDLAQESPWPRFAATALESGVRAVLSFRLVGNGAAGALNLYADAPHRFTTRDELLAALFADQAAIALTGARRTGQLNTALVSRDVIGRAKGILMERFRLDDERAFRMLVDASQHTNVKLSDVAEWLVSDAEAGYATGTDRPES
ncbi:GAF and ANTAR domain-containing protein [Actinomycetospora flava]|uniref:GAF and ANTAR domain-containing protein n=1 Tax=Actinomycetospora flava TaxID=3129232 RepID=A0ABU8MAG1_9PSEU